MCLYLCAHIGVSACVEMNERGQIKVVLGGCGLGGAYDQTLLDVLNSHTEGMMYAGRGHLLSLLFLRLFLATLLT